MKTAVAQASADLIHNTIQPDLYQSTSKSSTVYLLL